MSVSRLRRSCSSLGLGLVMLTTAAVAHAQPEEFPRIPEPSAHSRVVQTLALSKVTIDYSRPNLKGREIFGTLVPWGSVWRTGANASTKFELEEETLV